LSERRGGKVVGKCKECTKSQTKKDAERRVAAAEAMGQEDTLEEADLAQAEEPDAPERDAWCCMHRVLSLQVDFANEKPMLQHYLEGRGHVCMFLPKFHCELNAIEMLWGYAKYRKCLSLVLKFHSNLLTYYQVISSHRTVNFRRQNVSCRNVSICVIPSQYDNSFEKPGGILTHTRECFGFLSPLVVRC
jgi:hypothetical protein